MIAVIAVMARRFVMVGSVVCVRVCSVRMVAFVSVSVMASAVITVVVIRGVVAVAPVRVR